MRHVTHAPAQAEYAMLSVVVLPLFLLLLITMCCCWAYWNFGSKIFGGDDDDGDGEHPFPPAEFVARRGHLVRFPTLRIYSCSAHY